MPIFLILPAKHLLHSTWYFFFLRMALTKYLLYLRRHMYSPGTWWRTYM